VESIREALLDFDNRNLMALNISRRVKCFFQRFGENASQRFQDNANRLSILDQSANILVR